MDDEELNDEELDFLSSLSHHNDKKAEDNDDVPPRFPIISSAIITTVFAAIFGMVMYMMSYSSRYQVLFQDKQTKDIIESTDSLSSLSSVSTIYDNRYLIYGLIFFIFVLIEGSILLVHWYHVNRWEQMEDYDDGEEHIEE